MKKRFPFYAVCWTVLLVLFHVIAFVTPTEIAGVSKFDGAFWAGYLFITLAFIGQLVCAYIALKQENLQKRFYHIPLITISYAGLVATVAAGILCMAIPGLPSWIGIIVCTLVLGITTVSVVGAKAAAEAVESADGRVRTKSLFIKSLTADAESLIAQARNSEMKKLTQKVYEAVRYSDPMSNAELASVESQIAVKFAAFSDAVCLGNADDAGKSADELAVLLGDRNKKCRLLK
ncbi:MAG: hypothetical protein HFE85_01290 [Clostridiales bacterium]|nr:hypothetical protein [Clostridiales bacterium]